MNIMEGTYATLCVALVSNALAHEFLDPLISTVMARFQFGLMFLVPFSYVRAQTEI